MKPSVTITDSAEYGMHLCIRLDDILSALTDSQRVELVRQAAMDEVLIKDIVDQLTCGWTEDGCNIGERFLNELRIRLMPLMGEVAKEAIRCLVQERDAAVKDARRHSKWAWDLFHAWPRGADRLNIPSIPDFGYTHKISDEEARKIAGVDAPEEG